MKIQRIGFIGLMLGLGYGPALWAQTATEEPTPSGPASLQIEEQKLEIEKLKLEKDKLQLEMQKMQLQATQTAVPETNGKAPKRDSRDEMKVYQAEASNKAGEAAKANKDKENLLVLDLVNDEVWNKGVRYNLHELYTLAEDRGWKMTHKTDSFDPAGHQRVLYQYRNISLLRYENRDRGIFTITEPKDEGDFDFLTTEGISSASSSGDVRNNFQSLYFTYDREDRRGPFSILKYNHGRGMAFADKLEVFFDREGKMAKLRYGVLDEK